MRSVRIMVLAAAAWLLVPAVTILAAVSPRVYVANEGSDSVSVVDPALRRQLTVVEVGESPHNVQVSPDGTLAWVTNEGAREKDEAHEAMSGAEHGDMARRGEIWAIDTETNAVVAKVPVGKHPAHVVLGPGGRYAYVTNIYGGTLSILDVGRLEVGATVPVGEEPNDDAGHQRPWRAGESGLPGTAGARRRGLHTSRDRRRGRGASLRPPARWGMRPREGRSGMSRQP
ncbi:MAG TPA: YncE family protein [Thermodesulfobacteriota bacterium]